MIEGLLQPYLVPYPPLTPGINLFFFLTLFFTVVIVFFTALMYYANQTNKMKQAETIRLKELDDVKTKLYTNISHEFRTPLTIILGVAQQMANNSKINAEEGLQMIKRNGENLLYLINQMLDLSKLEAGAMPVNYFQGEITGYLNYIFQSFKSLAESKNIRINYHSYTDRFVMDFDPYKIMQIISNLLSNAMKYTPEGGEIEMTVDGQQKDNVSVLFLKVRDNGNGIPEDKLPYIFDRFIKSTTIHSRNPGEPVSAWLSQKNWYRCCMELFLWRAIRRGGTEFAVALPVTNNSKVLHEIDFEQFNSDISLFTWDKSEEYQGKSGNEKESMKNLPQLLIAEDNPDVAMYIESILSQDYVVKIATNGQAAFDLAIKSIPDIIISDVMMPVMNGFILCERLKTDERTSHIPVILLTAMASDTNKLEGLETGADAYLVKPFNAKELQIRTAKLIEQRRKLRERFSHDITLSPKEIAVTSADERFLNRTLETIEKHIGDPDFGVDF